MQNMKKRLVKKHKSVLFAKIGFCSRTDGMLGVDDLGESGCPRWSYGDGGSNTVYVSFTQNIHSVNLSYVLYRIQVVPAWTPRWPYGDGLKSRV